MDIRPAECRFRLQDEGKAYPKSSCTACGRGVGTGLGTHCNWGRLLDHSDRKLLAQAAVALSDAKRLWPTRHPATGMIMGIEEDCQRTYEQISAVLEAIQEKLGDTSGNASPKSCVQS